MGEYVCTWFGRPHVTARVVGSNRDSEKNVTFLRAADIEDIDDIIDILLI
jgi:hypothetical protein